MSGLRCQEVGTPLPPSSKQVQHPVGRNQALASSVERQVAVVKEGLPWFPENICQLLAGGTGNKTKFPSFLFIPPHTPYPLASHAPKKSRPTMRPPSFCPALLTHTHRRGIGIIGSSSQGESSDQFCGRAGTPDKGGNIWTAIGNSTWKHKHVSGKSWEQRPSSQSCAVTAPPGWNLTV